MVFLILVAGLTGCVSQPLPPTPQNIPEINPKAETANKDSLDVALYFSYNGEKLLAAETRTIEVPVSDSLEAAVVRALIQGPSPQRDELIGLFWEDVKVTSVDSNADIFFVTLSEEFINTQPPTTVLNDANILERKKLAIYSIVNTIIEMGKFSRVQICGKTGRYRPTHHAC